MSDANTLKNLEKILFKGFETQYYYKKKDMRINLRIKLVIKIITFFLFICYFKLIQYYTFIYIYLSHSYLVYKSLLLSLVYNFNTINSEL
jgi:hypothetical protein